MNTKGVLPTIIGHKVGSALLDLQLSILVIFDLFLIDKNSVCKVHLNKELKGERVISLIKILTSFTAPTSPLV